jgi:hypothetical protein
MENNIANIENLKKQMSQYNNLHKIDTERNYGYDTTKGNTDLAKIIHDNYDDMNDDELKYLAIKCMSKKKIRKDLLEYEIKYYNPSPEDFTLEEFIKQATRIINRYQSKAGGFLIEDMKWILHRSDSYEYSVKSNEVLFENSINKLNIYDKETNTFLKRLVNRLNNLATNIVVNLQQSDPEDGVIWLQIWCNHIKMVNTNPVISL